MSGNFDVIKSETLKKLEKERSKAGQEEEELESSDVNFSFSENKRPPTGSQI